MTAVAHRARRASATPALVLAAALLAGLLGHDAAAGRLLLPGLLVAALGACLVLARTRELCLVWLVLVGSILPSRIVPLSVAGIRTDLPELLGLALVGAVVARAAMRERFRPLRFTGPLVAIVGAAAFGAVVASLNGSARTEWLGLLKNFLLFLVPLVFSWMFVTTEQRDRLEAWVHRICTVGGLFVLGAAATGQGVAPGETPEVVTLGVTSEALRLRPALLTLTILATLLLVARTMHRGATWLDVFRFAVYAAVVAVSFTRSTWVPLVLALALLAVLRPGRRVPLRGVKVTLVLVTVGFVAFTTASSGALGETPKAITARIASIGSSQVFEENSYLDRQAETKLARQAIAAHPVTGIGLGRPYGAVRKVYDPERKIRTVSPRRFIHNSYLGMWLWGGLPGLLALLWLGLRTATTAARAVRDLPPDEGGRALAAGLTVLALGLQASFQTSLTSRPVIAALACAIALLDTTTLAALRKAPE
jgi:hypothetical protein